LRFSFHFSCSFYLNTIFHALFWERGREREKGVAHDPFYKEIRRKGEKKKKKKVLRKKPRKVCEELDLELDFFKIEERERRREMHLLCWAVPSFMRRARHPITRSFHPFPPIHQ